jgi:hypothetical protein
MFWWTGRGIWVLGIAALFVLPLQKATGGTSIAFGLAAAAATIFFLRSWFGESSLFSIPVRFWPALLLVLALMSAFGKHTQSEPNQPLNAIAPKDGAPH